MQASENCAGIFALKRKCYAPQQVRCLIRSFLPGPSRGCLRYGRAHFASDWSETSAVSFDDEREELDVAFAAAGFGVQVLPFELLVLSPHACRVLGGHRHEVVAKTGCNGEVHGTCPAISPMSKPNVSGSPTVSLILPSQLLVVRPLGNEFLFSFSQRTPAACAFSKNASLIAL